MFFLPEVYWKISMLHSLPSRYPTALPLFSNTSHFLSVLVGSSSCCTSLTLHPCDSAVPLHPSPPSYPAVSLLPSWLGCAPPPLPVSLCLASVRPGLTRGSLSAPVWLGLGCASPTVPPLSLLTSLCLSDPLHYSVVPVFLTCSNLSYFSASTRQSVSFFCFGLHPVDFCFVLLLYSGCWLLVVDFPGSPSSFFQWIASSFRRASLSVSLILAASFFLSEFVCVSQGS